MEATPAVDVGFALEYERRLRALSQPDVKEAKPLLLDVAYSQKVDVRLRYSAALCLLRSSCPLSYEEMSRIAAVGYTISLARDQARANSLLYFFLSHLPKEANVEEVQKTMTSHGWPVDPTIVYELLPTLAGKRLAVSFIE
jgi:hypothetical protein